MRMRKADGKHSQNGPGPVDQTPSRSSAPSLRLPPGQEVVDQLFPIVRVLRPLSSGHRPNRLPSDGDVRREVKERFRSGAEAGGGSLAGSTARVARWDPEIHSVDLTGLQDDPCGSRGLVPAFSQNLHFKIGGNPAGGVPALEI